VNTLTLSLHDLQIRWAELIRLARTRDGELQALLRAGQPVAVHNNTVYIRFKHAFHAQQVTEARNLDLLESLVEELFQQQAQVQCLSPHESLPQFPTAAQTSECHQAVIIEAQREQVAALEQQAARLGEQNEAWQAEIVQLKDIAGQAQATLELLRQDVETYRRQLDGAESQGSQILAQGQELQSLVEALAQQGQALREQVEALRQEKAVTAGEVSDLKQAVSRLSAEKEWLAAEVCELEREKKALQSATRPQTPVDLPPFLKGIMGLKNQ